MTSSYMNLHCWSCWMTRITAQYPDVLINDVVQRLEFYSHVFPTWLDEIRVYYDHEDDEGVLSVKQFFSRRFIKLYVCQAYANVPDDERDDTVLHEVGHIFLGPFADVIETMKEVLVDDETLGKLIDDQTEKAEEFIVVDLIALLKAAGLEDEDGEE